MDLSKLSASDGTGEAVRASVTFLRLPASTTLKVDSVTKWPANFIATSGTLIANGLLDPATITVFYGHLSGTDIIIDGFAPGYTDNGNTVSQVVVIKPTTVGQNTLVNDLLVTHNADGTLKTGIVTNAKLSTTTGEVGGAWQTYTPTFVGFSSVPSVVATYMIIGKMCHVAVTSTANGTSNANTFTVSLPPSITVKTRAGMVWRGQGSYVDNGVGNNTPPLVQISSGATIIQLFKAFDATVWATGGGKSANFNIWFEVA